MSLTTDLSLQFSELPFSDTLEVFPHFSDYTVSNNNCIDSLNTDDWILVQNTYQAQGGEQYLTIGCFREAIDIVSTIFYDSTVYWADGETYRTYHYIDDVFVTPLFDTSSTSGIVSLQKLRQLLRIIDVLGRESKPQPHVPLFYIYDDGTVEKKIVFER